MFLKKMVLPVAVLMALGGCQSTGIKEADALQGKGNEKPLSESEARAQQEALEAGRAFFIEEHDLSGDGRVTLVEFIEFRKNRFADGDRNKDGVLSVTEYVDEYAVRLDRQLARERNAHRDQTLARFKSLDREEKGYIAWDSFQQSSDRIFTRLDPQNTGRVVAQADKEPRQRRRSDPLLSMPSTHSLNGFLELYDEAASGAVTREDFNRLRREQFDGTDSNGDGRISLDEYMNEFMGRVDQRAEQIRSAQLRQAEVRYKAVDLDSDGQIDLSEYIAVGLRSFQRWDADGQAVVSSDSALPEAAETQPALARRAARSADKEPASAEKRVKDKPSAQGARS